MAASTGVVAITTALHLEGERAPSVPLDLVSIHDAHAAFVWASLQRLGVRAPDLEDLMQEVFIVVHNRLHTFDPATRMTTWLFGIARRVVAGQRRKAHNHRERLAEDDDHVDQRDLGASPEEALSERQTERRLEALLDELDVDKRAVFVMYELEEMPGEEIAEIMGIPVGTVYSRLFAARKELRKALGRQAARDAHLAGGER
jgi:RNA polymerase sigma-70 factor, ECF subfamily